MSTTRPRTRTLLIASLVALLAATACSATAARRSVEGVIEAPTEGTFYHPPVPLIPGTPGTLIRAERARSAQRVTSLADPLPLARRHRRRRGRVRRRGGAHRRTRPRRARRGGLGRSHHRRGGPVRALARRGSLRHHRGTAGPPPRRIRGGGRRLPGHGLAHPGLVSDRDLGGQQRAGRSPRGRAHRPDPRRRTRWSCGATPRAGRPCCSRPRTRAATPPISTCGRWPPPLLPPSWVICSTDDLVDDSGATLGSYAFDAYQRVYGPTTPGLSLSSILTPAGVAATPKMAGLCLFGQHSQLHKIAGPLVGHYVSHNPADVPGWSTLLAQNTPGATPVGIPMLIAQATTTRWCGRPRRPATWRTWRHRRARGRSHVRPHDPRPDRPGRHASGALVLPRRAGRTSHRDHLSMSGRPSSERVRAP